MVWECALEAFVRSMLVITFGSIALSLAGGIWESMAPSAPPGFSGTSEAEVSGTGAWTRWGASLDDHLFLIVFGSVFILTIWGRLQGQKDSPRIGRLHRILEQVSESWFSLIIGNAFGAMISAIALVWVQEVTFEKLILGWLLESITSGVQDLVRHLFGASPGAAFGAWVDWYGENQLNFAFWVLYLAAICDDLGLPNFKSLVRWASKKVRNGLVRRG